MSRYPLKLDTSLLILSKQNTRKAVQCSTTSNSSKRCTKNEYITNLFLLCDDNCDKKNLICLLMKEFIILLGIKENLVLFCSNRRVKCFTASSKLAFSRSKGGSSLSSQIELVIPLIQFAALSCVIYVSSKLIACLMRSKIRGQRQDKLLL